MNQQEKDRLGQRYRRVAAELGYPHTEVLRVSDRHVVVANDQTVLKFALKPEDRHLLVNEREVSRAIYTSALTYGVLVPVHLREMPDGLTCLIGRRLPGRPFMRSIEVEAGFPGIPQEIYNRLARLVFLLDFLAPDQSQLCFELTWADEELRRRFAKNATMAASQKLFPLRSLKRLVDKYANGFERRLQHHDMGPWNWLDFGHAREVGLIDAEFGGWRHRLYDAVYLLLQWTVNKPYPRGVTQWIAALEKACVVGTEIRTLSDLLHTARHAIAYRLVATAGELDETPAARARFTRVAELLLAEDFDGLAAFFRGEAFTLA